MSPTKYHRRFVFSVLVLIATATTIVGCSSGGGTNPTPETGSMQGVVGPPGAATLATATNNQGQVFTAVPDANTGVYTISNVPAGLYTVRFTPTRSFAALSSANPLVTPNQTAQAGTSFMSVTTSAALTGSVFWQHDGAVGGAQQIAGSISSDSLRIMALGSAGGATDVVLRVKPFTGLSTYAFNTGGNTALFRQYLPTTTAGYTCTGTGNTGALVITRYDAATRTIGGTFSFTASAVPPATGTAVITTGTLDLRF